MLRHPSRSAVFTQGAMDRVLIVLPPSETKLPGGDGPPWDAAALRFAGLTPVRERVVDALIGLSADEDTAAKVLGLGPRQRGEVAVNRALRQSATMPALERYTGVLFDALDVGALGIRARRWLGEHVAIHTAPFGPVGAWDPIPNYRLGASVRLPALPTLRALWREPVSAAWREERAGLIVDLRSEAYAALGPTPTERSTYVRVVAHTAGGSARALGHFNKAAKGRLVRALALDAPHLSDRSELAAWARRVGIELEVAGPGSDSRLFV